MKAQEARNQKLFNTINKLTDAFIGIMEKPFVSSYGSWSDRVRVLIENDPELFAKILELRPDIGEKSLSLCSIAVKQCLQTLQAEDICRQAPHSSTEEGYRDELVWFLAKILENREHLRRRGAFAPQGMERHFKETVFPNIYKNYENYLYDPSCTDLLVCPIENVTCLKPIELPNWHLRKITQEEFHNLAEANEMHSIKLGAYPEFILCVNYSENDWQEQIRKIITALRLVKEEKIHLKRIYHAFPLTIRSWEIIDAPEETRFAGKVSQTCAIGFDEEDELKRIWALLNQLEKTNYIMRAIRRFNLAYERERIEDSWVDYFVSLESLYEKSGEQTEVTYRLSNRICKALKSNFHERKEMRNKVRKWYEIRSQIVHGTNIRSEDLNQIDELNKTVKASLKWLINQENWKDHDQILDLLDLMP